MIEIQNVSYNIKNKTILNNISCKIEDNTLTAIIGPNGSGKSTLLKCIMRFLKYTGKIIIDGNSSLNGFSLAKQVAYFSQTHTIMFPHTLFDTVLMGRRPYAPYRYNKNDKELTKEAIEEMRLSDFMERQITGLSGGERQKTFFARALVQDTKHMLLDEPFNNLDPYYQIEIIKKLTSLKRGKTIVVVLHDIGLIRYFDRTIMLKECGIIANVLTAELNCDMLKKLFDIDFAEYNNNKDIIYTPMLYKNKN
jgi:iron complex transport system ATP-binding protein